MATLMMHDQDELPRLDMAQIRLFLGFAMQVLYVLVMDSGK